MNTTSQQQWITYSDRMQPMTTTQIIYTNTPVVTVTSHFTVNHTSWDNAWVVVNDIHSAAKFLKRASDSDWILSLLPGTSPSMSSFDHFIIQCTSKTQQEKMPVSPYIPGYQSDTAIETNYRMVNKKESYWIPRNILVDPFATEAPPEDFLEEIILSVKLKWSLA